MEQNLKPTVGWLLDLGVNKTQVAKTVPTFPAILGYSIEQNLKPTVQWLLDLGLSKAQVAKDCGQLTLPSPWIQHRAELEADCRVADGFGFEQGTSCRRTVATHPAMLGTTASSRT